MWVARDKNGKLWLHLSESKPYRDGDDMWLNDDGRYHQLDSSTFPNVKWADEHPSQKLKRQIVNKAVEWIKENITYTDNGTKKCLVNLGPFIDAIMEE